MIFEALIVDDEAPARVELTNQLERTGRVHVISEAVCLQEAIVRMKTQAFDVAFIDHNIAGAHTGLLPEALASMERQPMLIYMTAFSQVQDEPFGVDPMAYLVKPVDNEKLAHVVSLIEQRYQDEVVGR